MSFKLPLNLGELDFGDWIYGLLSGFISGGATTVVTGFTAALSDPEHFRFGSHTFYQLMLNVFLASGAISAMNFLRTKPLPAIKTTETTVQTTEVIPAIRTAPTSPASTVVTTVKETVVSPVASPTSPPISPPTAQPPSHIVE